MTRKSVPAVFARPHLRCGVNNDRDLVVRTQSFVGKSIVVRVSVSFDLAKRAVSVAMWSCASMEQEVGACLQYGHRFDQTLHHAVRRLQCRRPELVQLLGHFAETRSSDRLG